MRRASARGAGAYCMNGTAVSDRRIISILMRRADFPMPIHIATFEELTMNQQIFISKKRYLRAMVP
ncbi:hypothetical protein N825_30980 [Skermanella stibiiresistens SB22]|uniref:Uncharacterized protein n=1 Tax=Skermanella stibiiresistens SB22 TaxID=1385369 RepID=W9H993_9PROT|nr:hypothetical protein N825_30980 [Skermanella stibiiresistens SB22]